MPTSDILEQVLKDLDFIVGHIEKKEKAAQGSFNFSGLGGLLANSAKTQFNVMASFLNVIYNFRQIKKSDVDHAVGIIEEFTKAIRNLKLKDKDVKDMESGMKIMTSVTKMFDSLSASFNNTLKNFNPVTGYLKGRMIGLFYKNVIKGMLDSKEMKLLMKDLNGKDKGLAAMAQFLEALNRINSDELKKTNKALQKLTRKTGEALIDFLEPIIKAIDKLPKSMISSKPGEVGPKLSAFMALMQTLSSISMMDVITITYMGNHLDKKKGENIADFIKAITNKFDDKDSEKIKDISKIFTGFSIMLLSFAASLAIMVMIARKNTLEDILLGVGMITIMTGLVVGTIYLLSKIKSKDSEQSLVAGLAFSGILLVLTLVIGQVIKLGSESWKEFLSGGGMLLLTVTICIGLVALLSKIPQKDITVGLLTLAAVGFIILGLTYVTNKFLDLAERTEDMSSGAMWETFGLLMALIGGVTLIAVGLSAAAEFIVLGLAALGAITLLIYKIVETTNSFLDLADRLSLLDEGTISDTLEMTTMIMVGMTAVMTKAIETSEMGLMGPLVIKRISNSMLTVSKAIDSFIGLVKKVATLEKEFGSIESANEKLLKMPDSITQILNAMAGIKFWDAVKLGRISGNLNDVFSMLGKFANLVSKTANLEMIDGYTENGRPIYKKMSHDDFVKAAETISEAFSAFLEGLGTGLDTTIDKSSAVIEKLVGTNEGSYGVLTLAARIMFGKAGNGKPNFGALFSMLTQFTNMLQTYASGRIPVEWDKDGKATKYVPLMSVAPKAAKSIVLAFTMFLDELYLSLSKDTVDTISSLLEELNDGGIKDVMESISNFANTIIAFASAKIPNKWDKKGKPIGWQRLSTDDFTTAASALATSFTTFFKTLEAEMGGLKKEIGKTLDNLTDSGLNDFFKSLQLFITPITQLASGKIVVNGLTTDIDITKLNDTASVLGSSIADLLTSLNSAPKMGKHISDSLKSMEQAVKLSKQLQNIKGADVKSNSENISKGLKTYFDTLQVLGSDKNNVKSIDNASKKLQTSFNTLTKSLVQVNKPLSTFTSKLEKMNKEIIDKGAQRIAALKQMSQQFTEMSESLSKLNAEREKGKNLLHTKEYLGMQMRNSMLNNLNEQFQALNDSLQVNVEQPKQESADIQQQQPQVKKNIFNTAEIAAAVAAAVQSAMDSKKILQISLGDDLQLRGILNG